MHLATALLTAGIPLLPLLAGLLARGCSAPTAGRLTTAAAGGALVLLLAAATGLLRLGPVGAGFAPGGRAEWFVGLRLDLVGAVVAGLIGYLGLHVLRYARTCLAGDPRQAAFLSWLSLTLACVLTLALAGSLALIALAWIATSLCLHRLLLHHPERPGAVFAARKKFVVSRLADGCIAAGFVLLARHYGTGELTALFAAAAAGDTGPLPAAGLLLVAGAALKSAQFPFHSWLPDTMETPTPVSAFMHAGIVNAGGFLLVRLSPLLVHAPAALALLALVGALTAAFGAIVMLAQPGVKRALAYSTVAQMGFMLLQCGLGAFPLALLHLAAHSLYKAHAFLHAGSTVGRPSRAALRLPVPALGLGLLAGGLAVAGAATLWSALLPEASAPPVVLALIPALAAAYGIARAWASDRGWRTAVAGAAAAAGIALGGLGLHAAALGWFQALPRPEAPPAVVAAVAAIFGALFGFQALLWHARQRPVGRRLYVHALNGFYIGTAANRLLGRPWPRAAG